MGKVMFSQASLCSQGVLHSHNTTGRQTPSEDRLPFRSPPPPPLRQKADNLQEADPPKRADPVQKVDPGYGYCYGIWSTIGRYRITTGMHTCCCKQSCSGLVVLHPSWTNLFALSGLLAYQNESCAVITSRIVGKVMFSQPCVFLFRRSYIEGVI